ncbi:MAG: hypothetical protein TB2022_3700 [Candidatus Phytoplasma citri]|nr:MAG: hypothetical protein TB2022_3700 [Candidatus Phytoplasma aurantifolia]
MNKKNFWPKYFAAIMVGIAIIIIIKKNLYSTSKHQLSLFTLKSAKETLESEASEIEKPLSPKPKRSLENSQLKMKTTAVRLEPIKTYLFIESANSAFLPANLLEREKEEIAKIKKSWQSSLDLLKDPKTWIDETQNKCDEYRSQLNLISLPIESFKKQKTLFEKEKETKEKEVETKKQEQKQFKYLPNQPEEVRTSRHKYNSLQVEIDKINKEKSEIVGKIGKIKIKIGNLENKQEKYQEMLADDENYKKELKKAYEYKKLQFKNDILKSLHSLYDITSAEG